MRMQAVAVALLLVLAGCGAGSPTTTPTPVPPANSGGGSGGQAGGVTGPGTASPAPSAARNHTTPRSLADTYDIEVEGGDLPVEYALVHARVVVLLNRTAIRPPERVDVEPAARMGVGASQYPEFYRLLGITVPDGEDSALTAAAYVASPETVTVNRAMLNRTNETERTLAHESVHVVQFRTNAFRRTASGVTDGRSTTDGALVQRSVTEGAATYVGTVYARRYSAGDANRIRTMGLHYRNATGAAKLGLAPYYFGGRHVEGRVDSPAELGVVYGEPPETSEELLHGLAPGSESVAELSVEDEDDDGWEAVPSSRDRFGELFLRVVLGSALSESQAAAGADGWGADERVAFRRTVEDDRTKGYAWALRFDDAANATEFETVFGRWRDARAGGAPVRTERLDDRTVAVYLGDESFVSGATARVENDTVTVSVEDGDA